jgi:hypothetical protein
MNRQLKYHLVVLKIIIVILICFSFFPAMSQQERNFTYYNNLTYRLYTEQKWDSLKLIASEAIDTGFDFYYMRMRLGYAMYAKNKFRLASRQFEKAIQFNSSDTSAMKLLYYSYLYGGRENDALCVAGNMPKSLKKRNKINTLPINSVFVEGGYTFSDNIKKNAHYDFDGSNNLLGETDLIGDINFIHVGVSHMAAKWLSVYHGYSNVGINKMKIIRIENKDSVDNYLLRQNDYYICPAFNIKRKWIIAPAFHYLHDQWDCIENKFDSIHHVYTIGSKVHSTDNFLVSLSVSRDFGIAQAAINGSWSYLNNDNQYQAGIMLNIYPFANLNFYLSGSFQGVIMNNDPGQIRRGPGNKPAKSLKPIGSFVAGVKIVKFLWLEATAAFGQISNYNENNGAIVYNLTDKINLKTSGNLIFIIGRHMDAMLIYQYTNNTGIYSTFLSPEQILPTKLKYNNHSITGGLIWKL